MFAFRDFLRRFRAGVPGAPSAVGVPVDRRGELEAELAAIFAALEGSQGEAEALVARARAQAGEVRAAAAEHAQASVAEARARSGAQQSAATAARLNEAAAERQKIVEMGRAEALRIDAAARERIPALAAEVVARVLGASA